MIVLHIVLLCGQLACQVKVEGQPMTNERTTLRQGGQTHDQNPSIQETYPLPCPAALPS